ncbi:MAG: hypothetical protein Q9166_005904 [cf. Caloplaca sp. 2 TL-2023]
MATLKYQKLLGEKASLLDQPSDILQADYNNSYEGLCKLVEATVKARQSYTMITHRLHRPLGGIRSHLEDPASAYHNAAELFADGIHDT